MATFFRIPIVRFRSDLEDDTPLDGMCANTIALMRPIRFDSQAATRKEKDTPLQKKDGSAATSESSNLWKSHKAIRDCAARRQTGRH
jgi:hypothetical protein